MRKQIFNYRLSRARRVIENTFGIMAAKWRIFRQPIQARVQTVDSIVKAAVCLHNFILMEEESLTPSQRTYFRSTDADGIITHGEWRNEPAPSGTFTGISNQGSNNQTGGQAAIQEELTSYFMEEGCVDWQWEHEFH